MGSRQPKPAIRRYSAGDETSEAVQYSLQQINSDLARILRLLSTRPQAFGYSSVTQGPLAAEPVRHQSGVTQTPFVSEPVGLVAYKSLTTMKIVKIVAPKAVAASPGRLRKVVALYERPGFNCRL